MIEHFIEYEAATGAIITRGSVDQGTTALYRPPEGRAVQLVPYAVFGPGFAFVLDPLRPVLIQRVDEEGEKVSLRFVTPGDARAGIYQAKAAEARAWQEDNSVPTPILSGEAAGRGLTVAQVAAQVAGLANAWAQIAGLIEGARIGAKERIAAATTVEAALLAGTIDWEAVLAPAA